MDVTEKIKIAVGHCQAGSLQKAESMCREILKTLPDNKDALHLLGVIFHQTGNDDLALHYTLEALRYAPARAEIYRDLGNVLKSKGQFDDAASAYQKAIELDPESAISYCNLGVVLYEKGLLDEALTLYRNALELDPSLADAYYNIGTILQDKKKNAEALHSYRKAIHLNPYLTDAYYNMGVLFQETEALDEAAACYQRALHLNPAYPDVLNNLGSVFQEQGQLDEAAACYQKALQLNPAYAEALNNLGNVFQEQGKLDEAAACYQKSLHLNPAYAKALNNLGNVFQEQGKLDEAAACYQKALQLNPDDIEARWNMALAQLLAGNYSEGWRGYESRWKKRDFIHYQRNLPQPLWDGSDITGRSMLLSAEQGFGDAIQFVRYASLIAKRGAAVIVECQKELASLLATVEGVQQVVVRGEPLPEFNIWCPLLSLPLLFDTTLETIPAQIPYMHANQPLAQKWWDRMYHDSAKIKIGLVWSGNPRNKKLRHKSCSPDTFLPLANLENVTLYSLQKDEAAKQAKNTPEGMRLIDYTGELHDFMDTAALIENLDLVVSVDTAVAHLAGAIGKPVWTLLPFVPDWRWMLNREDSPWYPTMTLFRQHAPGDWETVIDAVKEKLERLLHGE
jgi:tetratricopeptide (TPR) repeat protein